MERKSSHKSTARGTKKKSTSRKPRTVHAKKSTPRKPKKSPSKRLAKAKPHHYMQAVYWEALCINPRYRAVWEPFMDNATLYQINEPRSDLLALEYGFLPFLLSPNVCSDWLLANEGVEPIIHTNPQIPCPLPQGPETFPITLSHVRPILFALDPKALESGMGVFDLFDHGPTAHALPPDVPGEQPSVAEAWTGDPSETMTLPVESWAIVAKAIACRRNRDDAIAIVGPRPDEPMLDPRPIEPTPPPGCTQDEHSPEMAKYAREKEEYDEKLNDRFRKIEKQQRRDDEREASIQKMISAFEADAPKQDGVAVHVPTLRTQSHITIALDWRLSLTDFKRAMEEFYDSHIREIQKKVDGPEEKTTRRWKVQLKYVAALREVLEKYGPLSHFYVLNGSERARRIRERALQIHDYVIEEKRFGGTDASCLGRFKKTWEHYGFGTDWPYRLVGRESNENMASEYRADPRYMTGEYSEGWIANELCPGPSSETKKEESESEEESKSEEEIKKRIEAASKRKIQEHRQPLIVVDRADSDPEDDQAD
ncbi:MAG: hypothetical protein O7H41_01450 [Planctomycetota bacterium]|nr:hypothetical protein [Planctomycetota bacterium]